MSNPEKISDLLNQLAMQTIMVESEDIPTLGSILESLENIEKMDFPKGQQEVRRLTSSLREVVEKTILKDMPDLAQGLSLLREGMTILQKKISRPENPYPPKEEEAFWAQIGALIGSPPAAPKQEEKGATLPSTEDSADITKDLTLYHDFISEGLEHLAAIELNIMNLEQAPDDKEYINAIFRPFHTIKGVSGFLNLKQINEFAHAMETLLDDARNQKLRINQEIIDFILEAVDFLKNMILTLKAHLDSGEVGHPHFEYQSFLEKIALLQKGEALPLSGPPECDTPEEGQAPQVPLGEILTAKGVVSEKDVQEALQKQVETKGGLKIGEVLVKESKAKPKDVLDALRDQKRASSPGVEPTTKIDTQKLDNLVDMIGELVIATSLVQQNPVIASIRDQKLQRDFSQLRRITSELQRTSMSLRMVPIRQTFQKMIRLVRDLARKSGKQVELVMSGEETEIDRNMVDMLYEPLVHMIRNSIDHGIESAEKRNAAGKPGTGKIHLRAFQKGGYIVIEIEDDGQGLNRKKILQKAQEKGLVSGENSLSEYQVDNLIFEPGFSTADQVTDISGRGVGMDVVRKTIEQLKGKVEIFSVDGKGCRFVIRVPLTLAIMDGIVVQVGSERYIIPTVFIKETLRPKPEDLATVQAKGELIKVRDTLLPLVRLYQLLGVAPRKTNPWEALVVVVENAGYQKGLIVDDLIGKQEVVIKSMGEKFEALKGVAGATIMGDGRVGLILDIHGIYEMVQMN